MKEENKYYTPSIEEFHVGFECEIESSYGMQKGIYPSILRADTLTGFLVSEIGESRALEKSLYCIRVKYSDKEDIESLGWKLSPRETHYSIEIPGDGSDTQMYYQEDNYYTMIYDWDGQSIFKGYIKNKSELIKLMKQLGIWKN